ncbi:uncharacterized protein THITE_2106268 [Thermothielavioides terrestris NRRL 8126]|uniref:Uncharacterized protein n=1 Tax=Thermothielavioides terrestris (strain ATCC 38088 / NRRL 8126) TaxID=578455 RepID=G2QWR4_THETT|nr:uncharacterized protein THITE_2106268 [Thermothielavioides terrestris NRRL 8126]AEO62274.1 hypothetical protein THITE_2106268 [Thermothielavioides terrestris NRRL 8126]
MGRGLAQQNIPVRRNLAASGQQWLRLGRLERRWRQSCSTVASHMTWAARRRATTRTQTQDSRRRTELKPAQQAWLVPWGNYFGFKKLPAVMRAAQPKPSRSPKPYLFTA